MTKEKVIPQIRFSGFTDTWEQRKLGDIASDMVAGGDIDKDLILAEGQYPVIANALTGDGIVGYYDKEYRVNAPAVTVTGRGDVGHAKARLVNFTPVVRLLSVKSEHDVFFLENVINTLKIVIESTGVPQLTVPQLAKYEVAFPRQLDEEEHIGAFFKQLDHLITLHQRKYDKLCVLKKSMLDKMFPKGGSLYPEIRFAGFTNPWEQRKLGEVAHFINGRAYSQNELLSSGKYPVLRVGNFYTNDSWYYSNLELEDKNYAYEGDLLYTWSATFGPHIWHGNKVIYHYHIWKVQLEAAFEKLFAFQLLERDKERILSDKNGSTMVHITKIGIENTSVLMPCSVIEQRQIGAFLDRLDSLITLHQRKYCGVASWMLGVALVRLGSESDGAFGEMKHVLR